MYKVWIFLDHKFCFQYYIPKKMWMWFFLDKILGEKFVSISFFWALIGFVMLKYSVAHLFQHSFLSSFSCKWISEQYILDSPSFCLLCCLTVFASASWLNAAASPPRPLWAFMYLHAQRRWGLFAGKTHCRPCVIGSCQVLCSRARNASIRMYEGGRKRRERQKSALLIHCKNL